MFCVKGQIVNIRAHLTLPLQPESSQREYASERQGSCPLNVLRECLRGRAHITGEESALTKEEEGEGGPQRALGHLGT